MENEFLIKRNVLIKYNGSAQDVVIPDGVKTIKQQAFFLNFNPRSITIPDGVKTIEMSAICDCPNLLKVTIPQSVTTIGATPFEGCWRLTEITNYSRVCVDEPVVIVSPNIPIDKYVKNKENACKGYLLHQDLFAEEIAESYRKYASRQMKKLLPFVLENDCVSALRMYANMGKITPDNYSSLFLNPAKEADAQKCIAFLLEQFNKN